eukprot:1313927-Pleurochrysis_carterae.AAC.1
MHRKLEIARADSKGRHALEERERWQPETSIKRRWEKSLQAAQAEQTRPEGQEKKLGKRPFNYDWRQLSGAEASDTHAACECLDEERWAATLCIVHGPLRVGWID